MTVDTDQRAGIAGFYMDPGRTAREARAGFWLNRIITDYLDDAVRSRPDAEYLVTYRTGTAEPDSLTRSELSSRVSRIAANLRELGIKRGDVVSFQIPNWWQFIALHLACVHVGAISNPLMPIFREREVEFMVRHAESRVFITPAVFRNFDHEDLARQIGKRIPSLEHILIIDGDGDDAFETVLLRPETWHPPMQSAAMGPDDIVKIMYTSGTTGEPKGVMHTSNTMLSSMPAVTERLGLTEADVLFMPSPFAHSIGFLYGMMMSLFLGARLVTLDVWNPALAADIMEREGVTFMFGATPFLADMANLADNRGRGFEHFRLFLTAGAPVPPSLVERAMTVLEAAVVTGYGMTELGLVTTGMPSAPEIVRENAAPALPHAELRVVDKQDRTVGPGIEGELQCRGSSLFVGYHGLEKIDDIHEHGWFATGDLVRLEEDGYVRIVGRSKDIIIRGGENIPVVEIENLIHEMPQVNEVAVVGMPDERLGERACAFVSLHGEQGLSFEQLIAFLEGRKLARNYFPEKLVIADNIPKTPVGKIQKFKLRESLVQMTKEIGQ